MDIIEHLVQHSVWEEMCPNKFGMPQEVRKLYEEIVPLILELYL